MTTTEPTQAPTWLNIDAIHPPEEQAKLPALVDAARGVLEAVAAFNRDHLDTMHAYYERNDAGPPDLKAVDVLTGIDEADGCLLLAAHIITRTVVGQGEVTNRYAYELMGRHAAIVEGVRGLYALDGCPLPVVGEEVGS